MTGAKVGDVEDIQLANSRIDKKSCERFVFYWFGTLLCIGKYEICLDNVN